MSYKDDEVILRMNGWEVECQSPFEIRTTDGYSFATNQAAYIVLNYLRPKDNDPRRLLEILDPLDKQYIQKLEILYTFIQRPESNFCIPTEMHEWCEAVGFKTTFHSVDDSNWWTVSMK
jgi:hypothetical protein